MFGLTPYNRRNSEGLKRSDFWGFRDLVDRFFNEMPLSIFPDYNFIRADIRETEDSYIIDAELPGVKKEEIKIELKDDILTISAERKEHIKEERDNYIRQERHYGSYSRSFYVENVRHEDVKARYDNGVLTITLPKNVKGKVRGRRIDIE